jgi:multicomponent Na+:H+ antiporter subunit E
LNDNALRPEPASLAPRRARFWRAAVALALVWAGLNGTDLASWIIGVPVVACAAFLATAMPAGRRWRLRGAGLPSFLAFFLLESLRGGFDVARRVFHPRLPVHPGFVTFETTLPEGSPRLLFANVVSLLPGTVSAGIEGNRIRVHALDASLDLNDALRALETRVARLFAPGEDRAS